MKEVTKKILIQIISEKKDSLKYVEEKIEELESRLDSEKVIRNKITEEIINLEEDLSK